MKQFLMILREIESNMQRWLGSEKILILKGARQVGKTTLLQRIQQQQQAMGQQTVFFSADNLSQQQVFTDPDTFWHFLQRYQLPRPDEFFYCFIDEFQTIPNAGMFLKNLFDAHKGKCQFIVSGSSSLEITKNTEFLTGRAISFEMERVSFREFFSFRQGIPAPRFALTDWHDLQTFYHLFRPQLDAALLEYLTFGGYPDVILENTLVKKNELLNNITKTYLEKDIAYFFKVQKIPAFNLLLKVLAEEIGNLLNKNSLATTIGIDNATLNHYLAILEGTYVLHLVRPYFRNVRSEISKMPKFYFLDMGLRNSLMRNTEHLAEKVDLGAEVENFLFLTLKNSLPADSIHFHRTVSGSEIDFCIECANDTLILLEAKWRKKAGNILAFKAFQEKYPQHRLQKIVATRHELERRGDVYYLPTALLPFVEVTTVHTAPASQTPPQSQAGTPPYSTL
jgi:hypothetical protein